MATKLQHTVTFPFGLADYRRAVTDSGYWSALAASVESAPGEVTAVDAAEQTVRVSLRQHIPAHQLPSAVTAVVSGDLRIDRMVTWEFNGAAQADGTFRADVTGAPATMEGMVAASGDAGACALKYTGKVTVRIPLVGGRIEKLITENLVALLDAERDFTVSWHENRR